MLRSEPLGLHAVPGLHAGPDMRISIPEGIREVIGRRLNRLSPGCNHMLRMAAVIGRQFRLEEVSAVLDSASEEELLEKVEAAVATYVLEEYPQAIGRYQFTHALIRETLYHELTTARRMRLHRRIGEAMEELYAPHLEPHLAQLAYHFGEAAQSGGADKAIAYATRAGARSMALLAYEEAVRFYQMALDVLERKNPTDDAQHCQLLLAFGEAQRKAGEFPQALKTLRRAAEVAGVLGSPEQLSRAALEYEETTWRAWLPAEPVVHLLEEVLRQLGEKDSALRSRTLGSLARALLYNGSQKEAAACTEQAVAMARRLVDPGALAFTLGIMLNMPWEPEETEKRLASANEILRLAAAAHDLELVSQARSRRLQCMLELGDLEGVTAEIEAIAHLDEELRQPSYVFDTKGFRVMKALLARLYPFGDRAVPTDAFRRDLREEFFGGRSETLTSKNLLCLTINGLYPMALPSSDNG